MNLTLTLDARRYAVDLTKPTHIAIPLDFSGPQPATWGVPKARSQAFANDQFIGDVSRHGSCNVSEHRLVPHCNGTHTECVGHILRNAAFVHPLLNESLLAATLISVQPEPATETQDSYRPQANPADRLITQRGLATALHAVTPAFLEALVIRTRPNPSAKRSYDYAEHAPPFFSIDAMRYLRERGVRHLLVDMPSVDRMNDEGILSAHRIFWGVAPGQTDIEPEQLSPYTITELIYVPDSVTDGSYLLDLQIAPFLADAAPSRPILYPLSLIDSSTR
jgi:kynurenine formamidase